MNSLIKKELHIKVIAKHTKRFASNNVDKSLDMNQESHGKLQI